MRTKPSATRLKLPLPGRFVAIASLVLSACAPQAQMGSRDFRTGVDGAKALGFLPASTTGYADPRDGRRYTSGTADGGLEALKTQIKRADAASLALAESILSVEPKLANNRLHVRIAVIGATLEFDGPFDQAHLTAKSLRSGAHSLSAECKDALCSVVTFELEKHESDGSIAIAGFRRTERAAEVIVKRVDAGWSDASALNKAAADLENSRRRTLTVLEVASGISTYRLDLSAVGICPSGSLKETETADDAAVSGCDGTESSAGVRSVLVGNGANGAVTLLLRENSARLYVIVLKEGELAASHHLFIAPAPAASPPTIAPAPVSSSLLAIDPSNPATLMMERERSHPEIQKAIAAFEDKSPSAPWPSAMRLFLQHAKATGAEMQTILKVNGSPVEALMITMTESRFFTGGKFDIQGVYDPTSLGAVGPWQLRGPVSSQFGLKALQFAAGKPNPCDERGDWRKSTTVAGRYFATMLKMFHDDLLLSVLGYRMGQNRVQQTGQQIAQQQQRNAVISELGFTFWSVIKEFRMANPEYFSCVMKFAGSDFVAQNPIAHGFAAPLAGELAPAAVACAL